MSKEKSIRDGSEYNERIFNTLREQNNKCGCGCSQTTETTQNKEAASTPVAPAKEKNYQMWVLGIIGAVWALIFFAALFLRSPMARRTWPIMAVIFLLYGVYLTVKVCKQPKQ